ncbi:hypothetical protein KCU92_g7753, partial [Aureobasidium melanogenum]
MRGDKLNRDLHLAPEGRHTYIAVGADRPTHGAGSATTLNKQQTTSKKNHGGDAKHTAGGIPTWSPTVVLICRSTAYVWQSGRDAQFSADCGRMC